VSKNRILFMGAALAAVSALGASASPAAAQGSASGTVNASLTVVPEISVAGLQDLLFGSHFPSAGQVTAQDGEWAVSGEAGTTVDLSFSILPTELSDGNGNTIALTYGTSSMGVWCDDGAGNIVGQFVDPTAGFSNCLLPAGSALVELGNGAGGDGNVTALVDGAPVGTYTAVIELTAVVN